MVVAIEIDPGHERLDRTTDVLQLEQPKFLEIQTQPPMHVIAHRPRNTDTARRTFGLNSCCHIHRVAVQVSSIGNCVANVDPDAKSNSPIGRLVAIVDGDLLLDMNRTAHRPVDAVEDDQQRVATGLNDLPAVLPDGRIDHLSAKGA